MSDPYVDDVELLCNWDGDDGETTYVSEIGPSPVFLGNSEIDTAVTEFTGSGTLLLSGSSTNADYNTFGSLGDFNWMHNGTESYTIEVLAYCDDPPFAGAPNSVWDTYRVQTDAGVEFQITGAGGSGLKVESKMNGDWGSTTGYFSQATWVLIAFKYDHTINKFWVTKRLAGGSYSESSKTTRTARTLDCDEGRVGYRRSSGQYYDGNIEGIRITRGVLRDTDYWPTEPWDGSQPASAYLQAPFIFDSANLLVYEDYSRQVSGGASASGSSASGSSEGGDYVSDSLYAMRISGEPELELPISSWQATAQLDSQQYLQCVVPAYDEYVADIVARRGVSNFSVWRFTFTDEGYLHKVKMIEAPLQYASFAQGRLNSSCTLSGRNPAAETPDFQVPQELLGVRSVERSAEGKRRVRCAINWQVKPGYLVYTGVPYSDPPGSTNIVYENSFTASYINYYSNEGDSYMDIGER